MWQLKQSGSAAFRTHSLVQLGTSLTHLGDHRKRRTPRPGCHRPALAHAWYQFGPFATYRLGRFRR